MRKQLAVALLLATLATTTPAFAKAERDSGDDPGIGAVITRVVHFLRHFIGMEPNDGEIVIPKP